MNEGKMMKKEGRGPTKAAMQKASGTKTKSAMTTAKMGKVKTSANPDGVVTKGKTKGTMIKMAEGGLTKREVKKADAAGRKVTRELKYDDMKDRMKKMAKGGKYC